MAAEEIKLVGVFKDEITPGLKKVNKSIDKITKSFARLSKQLTKTNREMKAFSTGASKKLQSNTKAINTSTKAWNRHTSAVKRAGRAARSYKPPIPFAAPRVRGQRGAAGGLASNVGLGGLTAAGIAAGVALRALSAAANAATSVFSQIYSNSSDFESAAIGLTGTIQALGGVEWGKASGMAEEMMVGLERIAATLPGKTGDYLQVMTQTFDEQIQLFGGFAGAMQNIRKGERSFTALLGLAATEAKMDPARVGMDLQQLLAGDPQTRIGILKYNATLKKFYNDNIAAGMSIGEALNEALKETYSPQRVDALKGTVSASLESFMTSLFSAKEGLFGGLRDVTLDSGAVTNFINELGAIFRNLESLGNTLSSIGIDPMVGLVTFLNELGYFVFRLNQDLKHIAAGSLDIGSMLDEFFSNFGTFMGDVAAGFINFAASINYGEVLGAINTMIVDFFTSLFESIDYGQLLQGVMSFLSAANPFGEGGFTGFAVVTTALMTLSTLITATLIPAIVAFVTGLVGFWVGAITSAATFITATLIPALASVGTFITTTLLPTLAAIAAPVLAVVGVVLLAIAVFRNWSNIVKLVSNGFKLWFASFKLQWATIFKFLVAGIKKMLGPLGGFLDKPLKALTKAADDAAEEQKEAINGIKEAAVGIKDQTVSDFKAIGDSAKGLIPGRKGEIKAVVATTRQMDALAVAVKAANSTYENNIKVVDEAGKAWGWALQDGKEVMVEWGSVAGTTLDELTAAANPAATSIDAMADAANQAATQLGDISAISQNLSERYPDVVVPEFKPDTVLPAEKRGDIVSALGKWFAERFPGTEAQAASQVTKVISETTTAPAVTAPAVIAPAVIPPEVQSAITATNGHTEGVKANTANINDSVMKSTAVVTQLSELETALAEAISQGSQQVVASIESSSAVVTTAIQALVQDVQKVEVVNTPTVIARIPGGFSGTKPAPFKQAAEAMKKSSLASMSQSTASAMSPSLNPAEGSSTLVVNSPAGLMGKREQNISVAPVINVNGNADADEISEMVAKRVLEAIDESSYDEMYTS